MKIQTAVRVTFNGHKLNAESGIEDGTPRDVAMWYSEKYQTPPAQQTSTGWYIGGKWGRQLTFERI